MNQVDCCPMFRWMALVLLFTVAAVWQVGTTAAAEADERSIATDRAALVALYNSTGGANWTNSEDWLTDEPLSEWHGLTVNAEGRVSELDLWNNNLNGSLAAILGYLSELEILLLGEDPISGSIPSELGNLAKLRVLRIINTRMTGEISSSWPLVEDEA